MVNNKHDHSEECKHLNLEYCPVCKVAYCKDCGKEWVEPQNTWAYPVAPYPDNGTTNAPWISASGGTITYTTSHTHNITNGVELTKT